MPPPAGPQNLRYENVDRNTQSSHVSPQFTVFASGIPKHVGVDHESLKSDTCFNRRGVLSGLRVLVRMIPNNPSNLIRVIPTKGARRQRRFSFGLSRSLFSESFPNCNLKGRNEFSKNASVE